MSDADSATISGATVTISAGYQSGADVLADVYPFHPALIDASPLKAEKLQGVDIVVIRELTGGLYFGFPKGRDVKDGRERAVDTLEYYDYEVRRVVELAFRIAKGRMEEGVRSLLADAGIRVRIGSRTVKVAPTLIISTAMVR